MRWTSSGPDPPSVASSFASAGMTRRSSTRAPATTAPTFPHARERSHPELQDPAARGRSVEPVREARRDVARRAVEGLARIGRGLPGDGRGRRRARREGERSEHHRAHEVRGAVAVAVERDRGAAEHPLPGRHRGEPERQPLLELRREGRRRERELRVELVLAIHVDLLARRGRGHARVGPSPAREAPRQELEPAAGVVHDDGASRRQRLELSAVGGGPLQDSRPQRVAGDGASGQRRRLRERGHLHLRERGDASAARRRGQRDREQDRHRAHRKPVSVPNQSGERGWRYVASTVPPQPSPGDEPRRTRRSSVGGAS